MSQANGQRKIKETTKSLEILSSQPATNPFINPDVLETSQTPGTRGVNGTHT